MDEISVRQLLAPDWEFYRTIRLEALKMHPAYFSPSRDETLFSELDWRERLGSTNAASFGLFDGKEIIGLSGIVRATHIPPTDRAYLVGTYIRKSYRRRGFSERLFKVRIAWAKKQKSIKSLVLEHREDNLPMQRTHRKFGFVLSGARNQEWPDGTHSVCLIYELDI